MYISKYHSFIEAKYKKYEDSVIEPKNVKNHLDKLAEKYIYNMLYYYVITDDVIHIYIKHKINYDNIIYYHIFYLSNTHIGIHCVIYINNKNNKIYHTINYKRKEIGKIKNNKILSIRSIDKYRYIFQNMNKYITTKHIHYKDDWKILRIRYAIRDDYLNEENLIHNYLDYKYDYNNYYIYKTKTMGKMPINNKFKFIDGFLIFILFI
jgi:hypothetical protein